MERGITEKNAESIYPWRKKIYCVLLYSQKIQRQSYKTPAVYRKIQIGSNKKHFKTIAPVIHLLSKRDKYTAEHSVRVALAFACLLILAVFIGML